MRAYAQVCRAQAEARLSRWWRPRLPRKLIEADATSEIEILTGSVRPAASGERLHRPAQSSEVDRESPAISGALRGDLHDAARGWRQRRVRRRHDRLLPGLAVYGDELPLYGNRAHGERGAERSSMVAQIEVAARLPLGRDPTSAHRPHPRMPDLTPGIRQQVSARPQRRSCDVAYAGPGIRVDTHVEAGSCVVPRSTTRCWRSLDRPQDRSQGRDRADARPSLATFAGRGRTDDDSDAQHHPDH